MYLLSIVNLPRLRPLLLQTFPLRGSWSSSADANTETWSIHHNDHNSQSSNQLINKNKGICITLIPNNRRPYTSSDQERYRWVLFRSTNTVALLFLLTSLSILRSTPLFSALSHALWSPLSKLAIRFWQADASSENSNSGHCLKTINLVSTSESN